MAKKRNLKMWVVMAVFLAGMAPAIAAGGTIYVDADASPGGDGSSWGTAYKYLQDALYKPPSGGDQIWVAEGTYYPDEDEGTNVDPNDRTETFQLINGVVIYGGFAGGETTLDERGWEIYETILSGDINTPGDSTDNSYHVVTGSYTEPNAILDGFTITAGNANSDSSPDYYGGGMYNYSGSPTVTNCTFTGNTAPGSYGCPGYGGGMYNDYSNPMVTNCTFSGNSAICGGGMRNCYESSPTLSNCSFSSNSANFGGGMANWNHSSPMVTNCTFSGNSTISGGGMCNRVSSSPTVTNCIFSGNSASYDGGGMYNYFSSPTLTNCTFSGNSADYGGGMGNVEKSPTMTNCILWGNTASNGAEIALRSTDYPSTLTISYSAVQGGQAAVYVESGCTLNWVVGNIGADPMFVDPDGPDQLIGTEDDNLWLLAGSPCIDAGDNTAVPGGVTTDLDGNPRFVDDPGTSDTGNGTPPIVDMGAYEYQPSIIFVDTDASGANDGSSWQDAYNYLQDALAVAVSSDYIFVAAGTYKPDANTDNPDGTGDREATFRLLNGVALYGGFPTGGDYWESRDTSAYPTILSGDLDGNDVQISDPCDLLTEPTRGENSYHVLTGSGTDPTAMLDGFTITAGNANEPYPSTNGRGGGMYNYLGSPTVVNCTFSRNSAVDVGGGMSNYNNSGPTVLNCTFSGNSALDGGGMDNENSSPMVRNCAFIGNSTEDGGGMCNANESSPTVTNCTFTGNSAISLDIYVLGGGGMCNVEYSSPTLTNCILWGNSSPEPNGPQIALKDNSTVSINYCDLQGGQTAIYKVGTNNSVIWGEGNIDEDPLFIGPNGPDGIGGTVDDEEDNVHLSPNGSPCFNTGDPGGDYGGQVDIDGQPRVAYGRVDMGADEVFPIAGDFEPDGDVDFADFAIFANHWLMGAE